MRFDFLIEITRRRVIERYIGTSSRLLWVLLAPLIPLLMNLAVFYYIARIPEVQAMGLASYSAFMFSGLLPFRFIQKATTESCDLIIGNMEMLKNAVFPLPLLSFSAVGAQFVELGVQCVLMMFLLAVSGQALTWSILLLPFVLVLMLAMAIGVSWFLSVAGYLLRDLNEMMTVLFSALLYITPTMYPPEAAPGFMQILILLNPLTHFIVIFRDTILPSATGPHWASWVFVAVTSMVVLALGYGVIFKARRYVGDMI